MFCIFVLSWDRPISGASLPILPFIILVSVHMRGPVLILGDVAG